MAVFRFRLQKIFELREREEDAARQRLARAQSEWLRAKQALDDARQARTAFDAQCGEDPRRPLTALDLRARLSTTAALTAMEEQAVHVERAKAMDVEKLRSQVVEAHRKVQVLERLRERAHRRWLAEISAQERKQMDDIRNRNGEPGLAGAEVPTRMRG